jgi:hypothetical protein
MTKKPVKYHNRFKLVKFNYWYLAFVIVPVVLLGLYLIRLSHAYNADINGDGRVNISDLSVLAANYGQLGRTHAQGDINGDNAVNISDLSILAANWGATTTTCATTASSQSLSSLAAYANQSGDRVITIPNGTYNGGGSVTKAHAATSGPCKGWLVLKAQSEGQVVVNLNSGGFDLNSGASRIAFVGIKFIGNGIDFNSGNFLFYRTEHSADASHTSTEANLKDLFLNSTSANDIRFYGSIVRDACDGMAVAGARNVSFTGSIVRDMFDTDGSGDACHSDHIDDHGALTNFSLKDTWIRGRIQIDPHPPTNMIFDNVWVSNSVGGGMQTQPGTTGRLTNVRFFTNHGEDVVGSQFGNLVLQNVFCEDTISRCTKAAPPASPETTNPGTIWRSANDINGWERFLF